MFSLVCRPCQAMRSRALRTDRHDDRKTFKHAAPSVFPVLAACVFSCLSRRRSVNEDFLTSSFLCPQFSTARISLLFVFSWLRAVRKRTRRKRENPLTDRTVRQFSCRQALETEKTMERYDVDTEFVWSCRTPCHLVAMKKTCPT